MKKESKAKTRSTAKRRKLGRKTEREGGRERKEKSRERVACTRVSPDMYTHREARTAAYPLWLRSRRYASSPPLRPLRHPTLPSPTLPSLPPAPTLRAALSLSLSLSPPPERSPHPRPAGYPPLVSASSVHSRPTATGSRRQRTIYAQLHPNYRNGTTPWVQMVHTGVK